MITEEYFHCCHVTFGRLNTRLQKTKSITPDSYRVKRVIAQFEDSIIFNEFHSLVYKINCSCVNHVITCLFKCCALDNLSHIAPNVTE